MNRIIYASSEQDADLFYATGFLAPDAFLYFEKGKRLFVALSSLEFNRGHREARVDEVINQTEFSKTLPALKKERGASKRPSPSRWISTLLKKKGVRAATISPSFPVGLADALRKEGLKLKIAEGGLFPERETKRKEEIEALKRSLQVTAELLEGAVGLIRRAGIRNDGQLASGGTVLTSERVQAFIRMEAARRGFEATHPIVAGGKQGCDPHERGHGPLRAREFIILDIFPRDLESGYWGDMTRTIIKGQASDAQRRLFEAVHHAQKLAISQLKAGVNGLSVHRAVEKVFEKLGYVTSNKRGRCEGFFHGTGHGVGLEIHESPRISSVPQKLKAGHVVTVEPGLYYPSMGGVRIEDVALIEKGGCRLLSHFPVRLEID